MICQLVDLCLCPFPTYPLAFLSSQGISSKDCGFHHMHSSRPWAPATVLGALWCSQVTLDLPKAIEYYFYSLLKNQLIFIWTNLSPFIPLKFSMDGFQNSFINFILKCIKTQIFAFSEYIMSLLGSACFHGTLKWKDFCDISSACFIDSDAESKQVVVNWWAVRALTSYAPNPDL